MKKNLLQDDAKNEIITRINNLSPDAQKQWGRMNVNQMLRHVTEGIRMAYGEVVPDATKSTTGIKRALMRFVVFKTDLPMPKGKAITYPEVDMVEKGINPPDFKEEQDALVSILKTFPNKPLYHSSPLFGPMTKENWARLNYGHIDHHLRQFGV